MLPAVPKPVVHLLAQRYIAGPTLEDACREVEAANAHGKLATIDVLGEEINRDEEARAIAQAYRDVFETIERRKLDSNVSVKLTALGLNLDYELCRENLEAVVREAARRTTSFGSTWRTPRRLTTRFGSTASCARPGTTISASSSRHICGGRSTTSLARRPAAERQAL